MIWKSKPFTGSPVDPYSHLAEIYDHLMRHVDYAYWADYIELVFRRFESKPKTLLELACGTGNLAMLLSDRGYNLTGVDRSAAMISVAENKARVAGKKLTFKRGDMVSPPVTGPFDAVLCLYDSVNYLLDLGSIQRLLQEVKRHLNDQGLFVFDACTEMNSKRYFHKQIDQDSINGITYIRRSEYLPDQRIQVNEFQLVSQRDGERVHQIERHEQRIYPVTDLQSAITASGLEYIGAFDGFTFSKASERSNRVHFVARRSVARE